MPALLSMPPFIRPPLWLSAVAAGGIAWNVFGAIQFAGSVSAAAQSLIASGLTPEQAAVVTGHPAWMTVAFAVGVAGGFVGSVLVRLLRVLRDWKKTPDQAWQKRWI